MIKVTKKQYELISKVYRFGGFALILIILTGFSFMIKKPVEFALIFLPYFLTKGFYENQFHAKSLRDCFILSLIVFGLSLMACIPSEASILNSVIIGLSIAFFSYKIGVIQFKLKDYEYVEPRYNQLVDFYKMATATKPFCTDTCTEEELRKRCKEVRLSGENTELAVEFFIKKTKQSVIADRLCIDEKSVTTRKKRLKAKLQTCD